MNIRLLFLVTITAAQFCKAQDTIVKHNGEEILAKVIEINQLDVKYKKINFTDGPMYIVDKSTIKVIKYANGSKEEFSGSSPTITVQEKTEQQNSTDYYLRKTVSGNKIEPYGSRYKYQGRIIGEKQLHSMLLQTNDKRLMALVGNAKDAKNFQYIGFAGIPLGIAAGVFFISGLNLFGPRPDPNKMTAAGICTVLAIACPITAGVLKHNRNQFNREAVRIYNEKY